MTKKLHTVYLGIGSNLGDRLKNLNDSIKCLVDAGVRINALSSVYETEPVGYTDQPEFLNAVIRIETDLGALELLKVINGIEKHLGRKRTIKWGPRLIDIDILLYDQLTVNEKDLVIPHPQLINRAFALIPLAEICGDIKIKGVDVKEYIKSLKDQNVKYFGYLTCPSGAYGL